MIQDVGPCIEHDAKRLFQSLKIRNQHFDAALRYERANLADCLRENLCPANVVVVAIHAGHNRVLQSQRGHRFGDALRFLPIDSLRLAFGHRAESATARANVAQQHEGRRAMIPALANVRALGRLTHRVQSEATS